MPHLLDALYIVLLVAWSPVIFWQRWRNGKYRAGWREKILGKGPSRIGDDTPSFSKGTLMEFGRRDLLVRQASARFLKALP